MTSTLTSTALDFDLYQGLSDQICEQKISHAKQVLGSEVVILVHHYQRAEVYAFADAVGDSLQLSQMASQQSARYIVFCGVHFMAEVADMLSQPQQLAILPDLAAGCSMADMASIAKVNRAWRELNQVFPADDTITPVTYINSAANLKAFCGEHGGIVCTSSNAEKVLQWAFQQRQKVLFFPDQHLGRWTAHQMGVSSDEMKVWDPHFPRGGLSHEQLHQARVLLWKGHCSVHQMFLPEHIDQWRQKYPEGRVMVHPECDFQVCLKADAVGSTAAIVKAVHEQPYQQWLIGTELNLVTRLAKEVASKGKTVHFMAPHVCMCSTMARIDLQHLAWTLDNLVAGTPVNVIKVPAHETQAAIVALERMLAL